MREFHVYFYGQGEERDGYDDVMRLLKLIRYPAINTQNLVFCDTKIITKYGYRLFIHPQVGKPFEITLGKCANTKREIKPETNILNLLLSGEFNTDDCKVVEEVL
jgi:hypothetical protein